MDTSPWLVEIAGAGNLLPIDTLLTRGHFSAATNAHVGRRIPGFVGDLHKERKLE